MAPLCHDVGSGQKIHGGLKWLGICTTDNKAINRLTKRRVLSTAENCDIILNCLRRLPFELETLEYKKKRTRDISDASEDGPQKCPYGCVPLITPKSPATPVISITYCNRAGALDVSAPYTRTIRTCIPFRREGSTSL